MKVTPVLDHGIEFGDTGLVRSPGLHVSELYNDLDNRLKGKVFGPGGPNVLSMAMGTAWENHLLMLMQRSGLKVRRPKEMMSADGVAFSPDLLIFNGEMKLGEIKLTSMSGSDLPTETASVLPPKYDKYVMQMKAYALQLGVQKARLFVLFLHKPYAPDFRVLDFEFTDQELQMNWDMLMNHATVMGKGRRK